MSGESVKVAVRVRPFNSREKDRSSKCCIEMVGALTQISDPDAPGNPPKEFTFDFSYWSHDAFKEDPETGYLSPANDKYADQRKVFDDLGAGVLDNAFKGFNCSLFAYGQTGAGKSYSMVGYGNNKGIVPITCDELFKKIDSTSEANVKYQVTFSMLEIYNEQVRDLLTKDNPKGGLQVRQNPKEGSFFVQGLKKVAVGSYKEIEKRTEEGTSNRTVAATQMNATSSRAHTVVTIQFDQIQKNEAGQETKKSSVINLVDLAGSERADSTGATGDRLKEGANINKSLSALGNVISALADLSMGKKKVLVPYRDSVLTKLLQNALGGNSKTIMIAALSPADINYDETLSTLRYADRAKKIKNKAVVNENPMDKLIRELREENEKLKKSLGGGGLVNMEGSAGMTEEEKEQMRKEMEEQIRAQLQANMESMMDWDQKLQDARSEEAQTGGEKFDKSKPHLVNLNEDPMLSGVLNRALNENETVIGRKDGDPAPDIILSGLSIKAHHAVITINGDEVTIKPGTPGAKTKVNGLPLTGERVLKNLDRVLFGSNNFYYFVNPVNKEKSDGSPDKIDWDVAQKEIAEAKGFGMTAGLSKEQQIAQEQILELLPLMSEVNAISEELDKHKTFEVFLVSGASRGDNSGGTKVQVRVKELLNGNVWTWERGKFMNRRYLMQEIYQKFLDGDDISKIPKDEDPFEDPPEDMLIGTANVFLQSLSYALDFDDKLDVTDYAGNQEGNVVINVTPCTQTGKALDEDYFVDDPSDLLGKPYHFKVTLRNAEVKSARFSHGVYCKFKTHSQSTDFVETPTVKGTLSPEFNFSKIESIASITQDDLDWFENGCITFELYGKQVDAVPDSSLTKMTTRELREMEHITGTKPSMSRTFSSAPSDVDATQQLKSELVTLRRKYEKLQKKEKRIQDLCEKWRNPPQEDFKAFFQAIDTAAYYQTGRFKQRANMVHLMLKAQKNAAANGGEVKMEKKVTGGSRACSIM